MKCETINASVSFIWEANFPSYRWSFSPQFNLYLLLQHKVNTVERWSFFSGKKFTVQLIMRNEVEIFWITLSKKLVKSWVKRLKKCQSIYVHGNFDQPVASAHWMPKIPSTTLVLGSNKRNSILFVLVQLNRVSILILIFCIYF